MEGSEDVLTTRIMATRHGFGGRGCADMVRYFDREKQVACFVG